LKPAKVSGFSGLGSSLLRTRSTRALELLVSAGFKKVKNLKGGINAWAQEVDKSLPIY